MYKQILVAIENSAADETILEHVEALARLTGSRLLLVHVADGWAARHFDELNLRESEEMQRGPRLPRSGSGPSSPARASRWRRSCGMGDPATEICRIAAERQVDLIAMATHGHRG